MKRASEISCERTGCAFAEKKYLDDSLLICSSCQRRVCVLCAAGFPNEITLAEYNTMIQAYKSIETKFQCHECTILIKRKKESHTEDWGVLTFYSTKPVTVHQIKEAETFSFSSLKRTQFPNGSTALTTALDQLEHAVCAIGNYGCAWGQTSIFRLLKRNPNSFRFEKEDQDALNEIISSQLNCEIIPHRILLLLPYVPYSLSTQFTGKLTQRETMSLSLLAVYFCEFSGSSSIVVELINGVTGRALRIEFLRALIELCCLFGISLLIDEALTGYRVCPCLPVPNLELTESEGMLRSEKVNNEAAENWLRSWSWQGKIDPNETIKDVRSFPLDLDSLDQGAVNASCFEVIFRALKERYGEKFLFTSTVDFLAQTNSSMVLSKAIGAGDLLRVNSIDSNQESTFGSMPNISEEVERGAEKALVNFHQKCQQVQSTPRENTSRPRRGLPTHGSQNKGMAFIYDEYSVNVRDSDFSPGRIFYNFEERAWNLEKTGSVHTAVLNIDKMERDMANAYSHTKVHQLVSPFSKRLRLRLLALLCEDGTSILQIFKKEPFFGNGGEIDQSIFNGVSSSGLKADAMISKKDCTSVFYQTDTRIRVNSKTRERQIRITGFKTNRPDKRVISISSVRSVLHN